MGILEFSICDLRFAIWSEAGSSEFEMGKAEDRRLETGGSSAYRGQDVHSVRRHTAPSSVS
ncbi:MAG: hypothetical protein P8Y94_17165, partial [Acidobacteriota bacterium]